MQTTIIFRKPDGKGATYTLNKFTGKKTITGSVEVPGLLHQSGLGLQALEQIELVLFAEGYQKVSEEKK